MTEGPTRREYLLAAALAGATGLAGCSDGETDDEQTDDEEETTDGTPTVDAGGGSQGGVWAETAQFAADDVESGDRFGQTLALSGDGSTAIVGAPKDRDADGEQVGSVYVFTRGGGNWTLQTQLRAPAADDGDHFGNALSLSWDGTTALINFSRYSDEGVYVFATDNGEWQQQATLTPEDAGSAFGEAVALSADGSTACIGDTETIDGGAAHVYTRSDGAWAHEATFSPADQGRDDWFGNAVSLNEDGSTVLVGAKFNDEPDEQWAGSAYLFSRTDGSWTEQTSLLPDDTEGYDFFGEEVELRGDGEMMLVGAPGANNGSFSSGAAYVFTQADGSWTQQRKLLAPENPITGEFGDAVALAEDGSTALVGAGGYASRGTENAGAAYLFTRESGTWSGTAKLAAAEPTKDASFGDAVVLDEETGTALVGASGTLPTEDRDVPGKAYVFEV